MRPTIQAVVLWAVFVIWMRFHKTAALQAKVKCSNWGNATSGIVYIDGRVQVAARDPLEGTIPDDTSLIAVRCYSEHGIYGGLIVSVSNGFVTDSFWRCSPTVTSEDWFSTDYNDTAWNTSHIIPNFPSDSSFPSSAKWIWARDKNGWSSSHDVVCRGRLTVLQARVKCSNGRDVLSNTVFINGVQVGSAAKNTWESTIPDDTFLIAVECESRDRNNGGLIVSVSNGFVTDSFWRCSFTASADWFSTDFNDSTWSPPLISDIYSDPSFPPPAEWIWARDKDDRYSSGKVFCRRRLGLTDLQARVKCNGHYAIVRTVYIDGVQVVSAAEDSWAGTIPEDTSVIAVKCDIRDLQYGGLIVSVSNGFVTDSFWRCSATDSAHWLSTDFNDTIWHTPFIMSNSDSSFPPSAKMIWAKYTNNDRFSSYQVFCRGRLNSFQAKVRCDDSASIYIDGKFRHNTTHQTDVWTGDLAWNATLIAVRCINTLGYGGLVAAFSNGLVIGEDWRCKDEVESDWYKPGYNDSSWTSAKLSDHHQWLLNTPNFPSSAKWMWSNKSASEFVSEGSKEAVTHCRGIIGSVSVIGASNSSARFYVDGTIKGTVDSTRLYWQAGYSKVPMLIAVQGSRNAEIAVFLSNGLSTDETWKCTNEDDKDWHKMSFEDEKWEQASRKHTSRERKNEYERLPEFASWISIRESSNNQHVYCRRILGIQYQVKCSGPATVYIDGKHEEGTTTAPTAWTSITRRTTRVIAIQCKATKKSRGVELSFSSHFGAGKWKCTDETIGNEWYNVDFNDTNWEKNMQYEKTRDDQSQQSMNTWGISTTGTKLFCRGKLECGCDQICHPANNGYDFQCSCREGFRLLNDKKSCEDIDECQFNNGTCKFVCYNTHGSYYCGCDCEHHCIKTFGSYSCSCRPGYRLNDDGFSCLDLNECNSTDHGCEHGCINNEGSYECKRAERSGGSNKIWIPVLGGVFFLVSLVTCVCIVRRHRARQRRKDNTSSAAMEDRGDHTYCNVVNGNNLADTSTKLERENETDCSKRTSTRNRGESEGGNLRPGEKLNTQSSRSSQSHNVGNQSKAEVHTDGCRQLVDAEPSEGSPASTMGGEQRPAPPKRKPKRNEEISHAGTPPRPVDPESLTINVKPQEPFKNLYSNVQLLQPVSKPIAVNALISYVQDAKLSGSLTNEFKSIPGGHRGACEAIKLKGARDKLRFHNIIPYDHSRVYLQRVKGLPLSDFVNASYIDAYCKPKYYIATQGPTKVTINDFWRMIWEQKVKTIVMVTNLNEGKTEKCCQYWPTSGSTVYGDIEVSLASKQIFPDFTRQTMNVEKNGSTRTVEHFQFTSWPDKGVPEYGSALLNFLSEIKAKDENTTPPVVVHCSAGVGRTGTYIAIDYLLEQAAAEGVVDVCGCVNLMRENRMEMVQTLGQYIFVYTSVLEALHLGNTTILCSVFSEEYTKLRGPQKQKKKSLLQEQYEMLEALKPVLQETFFAEAEDKNRDSRILPIDRKRPRLKARPGTNHHYINAVTVDGYKAKNEFVVTQMPLAHTKVDFWRLIDDYGIRTVVMLNEVQKEDPDIYFATDEGGKIDLGTFQVRTESILMHKAFTKRSLLVTQDGTAQPERKIDHLSIPWWTSLMPLPPRDNPMVNVFREVQRLQKKQKTPKKPVLIHCLDGLERSGMFCAMYLVTEKMNAEQEVDVFNSVKRVRKSRPGFINSLEQYKALHDMAEDYMSSFELYANFK